MSRTDKTRPWWVKLVQDRNMRYENHDHRKGVCDINHSDPREGLWCCYHSILSYAQAYPPSSASMQLYRSKYYRAERTRLRAAMRNAVKTGDDNDFQSFPHRHSAIWNAL